MKEKLLNPKEEILAKLMRINLFREFTDSGDEAFCDLLEAAAYSGNKNLFKIVEKILTLESIEQIIKQDPFFPHPKPEEISGE